METRKVQLSGGTTYTISLPKSWAQEQGIEAGSLVSIHPNGDGSLLVDVLSDAESDERTAIIDISMTDDDALQHQLNALYTVGYDAITLRDRNGHSIDRQQTVESAIDGLSGFELLEATDTRIQLRNLIDATNINVQKSAIRMRLVVLSMHTDAITAIENDNPELARRVVARDSEADKLFAMVTRHFRRSLLDLREVEKLDHSRERLFEYYYVCRQFERVADHAVKMARFVEDTDVVIPAQFVDTLDRCGKRARSIIERGATVVLSEGDIEMAHDVLGERDQLIKTIDAADRELYTHDNPEVAHVTGLLLDSIRRTAEYGANVAQIGIQQSLRTDPPASPV